MAPENPSAPSDSITARAGLTRSVAPTMATERGSTRGTSRMGRPSPQARPHHQRSQHAREHRAGEQRRDDGNDGVGFEPDRFDYLLGKRRSIAPGDEDRNPRFVEGMQKREQRADQDAG